MQGPLGPEPLAAIATAALRSHLKQQLRAIVKEAKISKLTRHAVSCCALTWLDEQRLQELVPSMNSIDRILPYGYGVS